MKSKIKMSIFFFFHEIRNRFFLVLITGVSITLTSYFYKEVLLFTICSNSSFSYIYTSITELFSIYLKLISFVSYQTTLWYFFFHFFIFLSPGLYNKEYYYGKILFIINFFLIVFSLFFFNDVLFPFSCEFFLSFQNTVFQSLNFYFEAKINDYFDFYITLYYTYFFYFELFICLNFCIVILNQKLEETKFLRKIFYFLICIFSVFISCFDVALQILFFTSFFFFYELIIIKFILFKNLT